MKKILVVHPDDRSTDFLKRIYSSIPNKLVLNKTYSNELMVRLIDNHDRVIMMGHGSPGGLFHFSDKGMNKPIIEALRRKGDELVGIWCYASTFFFNEKLKGFASGMFISEPGEAKWVYRRFKPRMIEESNNKFAEIVGRNIMKPTKQMFETVLYEYGMLAWENKIAHYNWQRIDYF